MNALDWVAVGALGGTGAVVRFLIDETISRRTAGRFPYGTLVINVTGAFILGLLNGLAVTGFAATALGTAAIGSYTTFSTWMLETDRLREDSQFRSASANIVVSLLAGFAAVALGRLIGVHL